MQLTDQEIEKLLSSVKITGFEYKDQQEVVGYYDVLAIILDSYMDIDLTERYIRQLHGILLDHSDKDHIRIDAWVLFFMQSLITMTERLEAKYETYSKLKTALNKRQQEVLDYIAEHQPAQVGDIEKALKEYSRNTLKKDLAYLVREGLVVKTGDRKGTRYHKV